MKEIKLVFPENIKTKKSKAAYTIFHYLYKFDMGRGSVVGRFTTLFPEVGWFFAFLQFFGLNLTKTKVIVTVAIAFVFIYWLGHLYTKYNLDRINSMVGQSRDQYMRDIRDAVKAGIKGEEL